MYCAKCNAQLAENVKFCKYCGGTAVAGAPPPPASPPKKKRSSAPLIMVLLILLILAIAAVGMVYNDNYKTVLTAVGLGQYVEPETTVSETEPTTTAPIQTTEAPTTTTDEYSETEPLRALTPTTITPSYTEAGEIPPTAYRVYFENDHDHTLFIRVGPSQDYRDIGSIPARSIVVVTRIVDGWAYLTYNGITGWSSMDYLFEVN